MHSNKITKDKVEEIRSIKEKQVKSNEPVKK